MSDETPLWSGSSSQIVNLPIFILCLLFCWLVVPVFIAVWKWLAVKTTTFELSTERLKMRRGILNRKMDELELYRVRDYRFEQPFFLRIFGLGNLTLTTADKSNPVVLIPAVSGGEKLREMIRNSVEACRARKGSRDIEVD